MINNQHKNKERSRLWGGQKSATPVQTTVQMSCLCTSHAVCSSGPLIPSWSLPDETWHLHLQRNTSRGVLFCLKKEKKRKKDKGRKQQCMTVGNWQHQETLSSLAWLIYWTETSEAQDTRGHRSTHGSSLSLSLCISYLLTYIYLYIYIFFYILRISWFQLFPYEHRCDF